MKTYVINGFASTGFGEAISKAILEKGYKVIGLYSEKNKNKAYYFAREYPSNLLEIICVDIFDFSSLKSIINSIDQEIDGFINADFTFEMEDVDDFDYCLAERIFKANYLSPMLITIELKKLMKTGASIVIVTSTEADRGSFGGITYAASKAAMHNLIKSLACNWGKIEQIRVNAVAAGWIGGEMDTDGPFEISRNITPLGRLGKAEEVADAVLFLLSNQSSFVNAQVLYVDGGYLAVDEIAKYEFESSNSK